jgi:general secretion pathway protein H
MNHARLRRPLRFARAPHAGRQEGLTLLELLVVLSIMAIVAAVAGPYLAGGVSGPELKGAARQVAAGLRLARSEALSTRREARLVVDLERHTFRVDGDAREHALPKDAGVKLFTAQNDLVSDRVGAIRFYPDGGSNGGRITIAAGERKYEVDVDWLTGRVAILD